MFPLCNGTSSMVSVGDSGLAASWVRGVLLGFEELAVTDGSLLQEEDSETFVTELADEFCAVSLREISDRRPTT